MGVRGTYQYHNCWGLQSKEQFYNSFGDQSIFSVQAGVKKYDAALKIDWSGGDAQAIRSVNAIGTVTDAAHGRWMRVSAAPAIDDYVCIFGTSFGNLPCGSVGMDSGRHLTIVSTSYIRATGAVALDLNTWYWVAIRSVYTSPNNYHHYLRCYDTAGNLVEEFDTGGGVVSHGPIASFTVGTAYLGTGNGLVVYLDGGICVSDAWPPVIPDFRRDSPTGIGTVDQWASSVPGDKWLDVDEIPHNSDTDYIHATISARRQCFTFDASGLAADENIWAVGVHTAGRSLTSSYYLGVGIQLAAAVLAKVWVVTTSFVAGQGNWSGTKPGGGDWSTADLDNSEGTVYPMFSAYERRVTALVRETVYGGYYPPIATLTGTAVPTITEADVVTGGKTIIITLDWDAWVAAGGVFDAQRQNIIDGLDSAQAEGTGWNAEVRDKEVVGAVVRTNDTVVTITLTAAAAYDITAHETITVTVPPTAVVSGETLIATPTFLVTALGFVLKISGVAWVNVKKVSGVANASIKRVSGVTAN